MAELSLCLARELGERVCAYVRGAIMAGRTMNPVPCPRSYWALVSLRVWPTARWPMCQNMTAPRGACPSKYMTHTTPLVMEKLKGV
jgi:hypothetical protein